MTEVLFFQQLDDELLKHAAVAARYRGKWVLMKRGGDGLYEMPACPRRDGENIEQTARRGLCDGTGAARFRLRHVSAYAVKGDDGSMDYGMLYFAEIQGFFDAAGPALERVGLFGELPEELAFPHTQPTLLRKAEEAAGEEGL